MMSLASLASRDHDPSDVGLIDSYHQYFEDYDDARQQFQLMAFRLARMVLQETLGEMESEGITMAELSTPNETKH